MKKKIISACLCVMSIILCNARVQAQGADINPSDDKIISTEELSAEEIKTDDLKEKSAEKNEKSDDEKQKRSAKRVLSSEQYVITATKSDALIKETGATVTVITEEEIQQKGRSKLVDLLDDVPGITVSRNSSLGGQAGAFMRGTNSAGLLILIDGVKVNDPTHEGRGFNLGHLTSDNVERIEIIRGSQGVIHGSDAVGGVINIITKKGKGDPQVTVKAEAGSYSTFQESIAFSGGTDKSHYGVSVSRIDSSGFSKAKDTAGAGNFDRDRYAGTDFSTNMGITVQKNTRLDYSLRYNDSKTDIDDWAKEDDSNRYNDDQLMSSTFSVENDSLKWLKSRLIFSNMNINRIDRDDRDAVDTTENDTWTNRGSRSSIEWRNRISVGDIDDIIIGAEADRETLQSFSNSWGSVSNMEKDAWQRSVYLHNTLKINKKFFFSGGLRYTQPEHVGSELNYQLGVSLLNPSTDSRIKSTWSTGYKVPSLYQLYDSWSGNPDLKPEKSRSFDAGIEQAFLDEELFFEINYFNIDYTNMIGYTTKYANVPGAEIQGIEFVTKLNLIESLSVNLMYTYTDSKDKQTGKALLKRPAQRGGAVVNWIFLDKKGNLNLAYVYTGERKDAGNVTLDGYQKIDLAASYWIRDYLQVFGRVENILNEKYEEAAGFNTPARSFYGGLKSVF